MNYIKIDSYIENENFFDSIIDAAKIIRWCIDNNFDFYVEIDGEIYENDRIDAAVKNVLENGIIEDHQKKLIFAAVISLGEKESGEQYLVDLDDYSLKTMQERINDVYEKALVVYRQKGIELNNTEKEGISSYATSTMIYDDINITDEEIAKEIEEYIEEDYFKCDICGKYERVGKERDAYDSNSNDITICRDCFGNVCSNCGYYSNETHEIETDNVSYTECKYCTESHIETGEIAKCENCGTYWDTISLDRCPNGCEEEEEEE